VQRVFGRAEVLLARPRDTRGMERVSSSRLDENAPQSEFGVWPFGGGVAGGDMIFRPTVFPSRVSL
jgi:hypothetical protein